ncbi:Actin-like protein [Coelomomyces lativittatus]|nr:Actin-like protein [Coelomomyces lativittatus]
MDFAGRDITHYLQLLLRKSGYSFTTSAEIETVKDIKESMCYISQQPSKEEKEISTGFMHARCFEEYVLPDQRIIKLGTERFKAPEILFHPDFIGLEYPGIHQLLLESILKSDLDLRPSFFSNIILSGGSTLFKGIGERLLNELKLSVTSKEHKDTKIKIFAPQERKYATWMGGSILASLSTFKKMWVSADEYQEDPDIIHKRSLS